MRSKKVPLVLVVLLLVPGSFAIDLRKSAEKATGKSAESKKPAPNEYHDTAATSSFGTGTFPTESGGESFLGSFWTWLIAAPLQYRHDDPSSAMNAAERDGTGRRGFVFPEHAKGEATVPYVRADYNRQRVDSETDADDVRLELGYKSLAFHGRSTMYATDSLNQDLDINQFFGVVRYGGFRPDFVPGTFEAGIGVGVCTIRLKDDLGVIDDASAAVTFPLKYYPVDWCGIEFRPAWYTWSQGSRVGDYDLSVSAGQRYLHIRLGYRWLTSLDIDGPYAGLSASF